MIKNILSVDDSVDQTHSYIFSAAFWTQGQQSQAVLEVELGYTLDRWPVNHRADTERINWQAHMQMC